jgi:hypothetical protein
VLPSSHHVPPVAFDISPVQYGPPPRALKHPCFSHQRHKLISLSAYTHYKVYPCASCAATSREHMLEWWDEVAVVWYELLLCRLVLAMNSIGIQKPSALMITGLVRMLESGTVLSDVEWRSSERSSDLRSKCLRESALLTVDDKFWRSVFSDTLKS